MPFFPSSKGVQMHVDLASLGWDEHFSAELGDHDAAIPARVVGVDRGAIDVITSDNPLRIELGRDGASPAVGDWVTLVAGDDRRWAVEAILRRRSAFGRASVAGEAVQQVIAANVDTVLIVLSAVPKPRPTLAQRLVALGWDSGATPVIVISKCDLAEDADAIAVELAEATPGVDVVTIAATLPDGLDSLVPYLSPARTLCMVGRSGAGKSTLANALLGAERFAVTGVRDDGKGRHTTTRRALVQLPGGALLIDTPGLRGVGLWITEDGLDKAFADVEELVPECRFTDCSHRSEPGCAVLGAVGDGRLPVARLDSWRKLQREARWMASRHDARVRAEERAKWKAIHMEMRRSGRARP